jgi:regulator of protease activity HflC (stomatin/prohibitin superfamily)
MSNGSGFFFGTAAAWLVIFFIVGGLWGCPTYRVWQQEKEGEAERARAEQNRQITITEAIAKNEAATSQALARVKQAEAEAEAEIIRARGAAKANAIIDSTLTERYLRYRWVEGLHDGRSEVIYVPTEANLPILEAGKRP